MSSIDSREQIVRDHQSEACTPRSVALLTSVVVAGALFVFGGSVLASGAAEFEAAQPATQASSSLPKAEEVFERYIEVIGGREKLEKIKNRRVSGTYQGDPFEFRANLKVWSESDGRFHQRVAEPAGLRYDLFVVDNMTWSVVMDGEPTPIGRVQRQELLDTADFYGEANYKNRYKEIKTVREAVAGDTAIYVISATTHAGRPHTLYFAKDSGLLIGNRVPVTGPNETMRDMTVRIQNYKDIGGVLYPTLFIQEFGGGIKPNRYEFTDVKVNVDDGHEYPVPENVRAVFEAATKGSAGDD